MQRGERQEASIGIKCVQNTVLFTSLNFYYGNINSNANLKTDQYAIIKKLRKLILRYFLLQ